MDDWACFSTYICYNLFWSIIRSRSEMDLSFDFVFFPFIFSHFQVCTVLKLLSFPLSCSILDSPMFVSNTPGNHDVTFLF